MAVLKAAGSYTERMPRALAGLWADMQDYNSITRTCKTAAGIGFGLAVSRDATFPATPDGGCVIGGDIDSFLGVSIRDVTLDPLLSDTDKFAENQNMSILTYGTIWVSVTGTPGPDDPVHFNATTGVFAASGGTGPILGARWLSNTVSGLCKLHLPAYGQAT